MFNKEFIEKKLSQIIEYIEELRPIVEKMSSEEIKNDYFKCHTAERLLQLVVDTMLDINIHFIKEKNLNVPDELQNTFRVLAENKILNSDFADKIAPIVGLRNRIVHRYEKLDKDLFIHALKKNYGDFKEYVVAIQKNLI